MNEDLDYLRSPRSKSGFKNVKYHKGWDHYQVYYYINGQRKYLGSWKDPVDAARAYHEHTKNLLVDCTGLGAARRLGESRPRKKVDRTMMSYLEQLSEIEQCITPTAK